jgi:hypothetical protein
MDNRQPEKSAIDRFTVVDGRSRQPFLLTTTKRPAPRAVVNFQRANVARPLRCPHLGVNDDGVEREESVGAQDELTQVSWREFWNDNGCAGPLGYRRLRDSAPALRPLDRTGLREHAAPWVFVNDGGIRTR